MTDTNRKSQQKRRSKRRRSRFVAVLLVICALALPLLIADRKETAHVWALIDPEMLRVERFWRKALWRTGHLLPNTPELGALPERLASSGRKLGDAMLIRIFKQDFELEVWLRGKNGFEHFATYPVCYFSGWLGPKLKQGDHQAPEGFYTVSRRQMNPNSRWHRSFNLGFPNAYDRSHKRTGSFLMVHGGCSSVGCYAMTNKVMDELWRLMQSAFANGQRRIQVQAFPFRMTEANLAARADHRWLPFWENLKQGNDLFEQTRLAPLVKTCGGRYVFQAGSSSGVSANRITRDCSGKPRLSGANLMTGTVPPPVRREL